MIAPTSDARLSALYRQSVGTTDCPSAAADQRILVMAAAALRPPRVVPAQSGWRSWLHAQWFKPGLAFAALASLSVVIVAVLPKEELSVERADSRAPATSAVAPVPKRLAEDTATAPGRSVSGLSTAATALSPAGPASPLPAPPSSPLRADAKPSLPMAPAYVPALPIPQSTVGRDAGAASGPAANIAAAASGGAAAPARKETKPKDVAPPTAMDVRSEGPAPANAALAKSEKQADAGQRFASPPAAAVSPSVMAAPPAKADSQSPASDRVANPFPAQSPAFARQRAEPSVATAPPPAVEAPPAPPPGAPAPSASPAPPSAGTSDRAAARPGKASLQSESIESRIAGGSPALPEVRDAAPTYANEQQPSIPMPYMYRPQRPADRASAGGQTAAAGAAPIPPLAQQSAAPHANAMMARRSPESLAAAPPLREPNEWIKAIEKLRVEGRAEQVAKELAEFRRSYPLHPLPDALKALLPR
ncbi:MAG: hypothetical protein ABI831_16655 [Betaproteobacteria bacterium]